MRTARPRGSCRRSRIRSARDCETRAADARGRRGAVRSRPRGRRRWLSARCAAPGRQQRPVRGSTTSSTGSMAAPPAGIGARPFDYGSRGAVITLEHVSKSFPGGSNAVKDLSLEIPGGKTCVLIGPSGCGKTTTLRMINRLTEPDAGRILVDGEDTSTVDPVQLRLKMGYVIQQTGLFPHLTVGQNVATVPRLRDWDSTRIQDRVQELL